MRYECSFPGCSFATLAEYCRDHRAFDDGRVTCLVCRRAFDSLPFYGCCSSCYVANENVRSLVDDAHPQTIRAEVA